MGCAGWWVDAVGPAAGDGSLRLVVVQGGVGQAGDGGEGVDRRLWSGGVGAEEVGEVERRRDELWAGGRLDGEVDAPGGAVDVGAEPDTDVVVGVAEKGGVLRGVDEEGEAGHHVGGGGVAVELVVEVELF